MPNVLTYVDEPLARQIATGLIGSEVSLSERRGSKIGINFNIIVSGDRSAERATTTRLSDLLPEVVAGAIYDAVAAKIESLATARSRLVAGGTDAFPPGTPIVLLNAQLSGDGKCLALLSGEECIQYRLRINEFYLHAYCPKSAEIIFDSLVSQPVEVAGLLRYTPPYTVPGALSLSLGLRVCAVWLR